MSWPANPCTSVEHPDESWSGEPLHVKAGECKSFTCETGLGAAAIKAKDCARLGDSHVGVHAGARLDGFVYGPGPTFVATDFDADVFSITALAGFSFAL